MSYFSKDFCHWFILDFTEAQSHADMSSCIRSLLPLVMVAIRPIFAISDVRYSGKGNLVKIMNGVGALVLADV
ncbi:hypothetical protein D1013_08250 [Euzebyella marina]|uniref:Uncharacterized protein n=1 Tax=Euzebyella marina TaxID=1761453 RepID=A0A3G2L585_9FLAO|nr:hypothetical protein D1013_08250 [Euzebyella marina]